MLYLSIMDYINQVNKKIHYSYPLIKNIFLIFLQFLPIQNQNIFSNRE